MAAEKLDRAVEDVLETMFFTGVEAAGDGIPAHLLPAKRVVIRFHGAAEGWLALSAEDEAARNFAATLLADDADDEQAEQAAGELANMICGSFLSRLHPEARLSLTAPGPAPDAQTRDADMVRWYRAPEGAFAVAFHLA